MILLVPRVSEKTYAMAGNNVYVFNVPLKASKQQIAAAVSAQYEGVKVADVRCVVMKGKTVQAVRGRRRAPGVASRKDTKKAYVSLSEGTIAIFKEGEEA